MNNCKDCKWWKFGETEEPGYGQCKSPKQDDPESGFTGGDGGEPFNSGTFACGPMFGCVHWTAKDE